MISRHFLFFFSLIVYSLFIEHLAFSTRSYHSTSCFILSSRSSVSFARHSITTSLLTLFLELKKFGGAVPTVLLRVLPRRRLAEALSLPSTLTQSHPHPLVPSQPPTDSLSARVRTRVSQELVRHPARTEALHLLLALEGVEAPLLPSISLLPLAVQAQLAIPSPV